ncbi:MAG: TauD/TfdA family dioxygenase [Burkholderiales bacterium]|nr:TauD/TfdA family dioxygenase [Burkholderiales bacterium]
MASNPSLTEPQSAAIRVRRLGVFLGAEVSGVDLSRPLEPASVDAIRHAHAEHGVLVFPDQRISGDDLMRFGRCFGELSVHPFSTSSAEHPELIVYDNREGNPPAATDIWHSDETFRECPPMGTALCSKIIPGLGGDTVFCSMAAVYEGLSDRMQHFLSGLEAVHDFKPFKPLFSATPEGRRKLHAYEERYPPVVHPVVRVHPVTGRKAIFVNPQFTITIKGMEESESRALLESLYRRTATLEYQYRHRWAPDMLVFWDNRWIQHAAVHDYYPQRRLMERVTIAGDRPAGDAAPADPATLRRYLMPPITAFESSRRKRQHDLD